MIPDFGATADDYRRHRAGFPESFFAELVGSGIVKKSDRALDIGTGTGTLARGLARIGCRVTGLDISEAMIDSARTLDAEAGVDVEYVVRRAEDTGFDAASFDLVTAAQCWHWFDRKVAAAEVRRLLKPGGAVVIAHHDWIPLQGNVVERTEQLIERCNPRWKLGGGTGIHDGWFRDLSEAGFVELISRSYDEPVIYTHEGWRGRIRASAGVGGDLEPDRVEEFDRELARLLEQDFPDPVPVPHRLFFGRGLRPYATVSSA